MLPPGFVAWAVARILAMTLLVGAGWVVYDSASSDRFRVHSVRVQGNVLLSRAEVEGAAAVTGVNVFWVDRGRASPPRSGSVAIGATWLTARELF